jgi:hypothetical protein
MLAIVYGHGVIKKTMKIILRPAQPVQFVMQRCREYRCAYEVGHVVSEKQCSLTWIGWKPPVEGWVKINTDGACKGINVVRFEILRRIGRLVENRKLEGRSSIRKILLKGKIVTSHIYIYC